MSRANVSAGARPPPPVYPPRLSISGRDILDEHGQPFVPRGFSWNRAWRMGDGAAQAALGANIARLEFRWFDNASLTPPYYPPESGQDSYNPNAPGNIDPGFLADIDMKIADATGAGLWVDLAMHPGSNSFWTDPLVNAQFLELWVFLAQRYKTHPKIAWFELIVEPSPLNDPYNSLAAMAVYRQAIDVVRAVDPLRICAVGACKNYSPRNVASMWMPDVDDLVYVINFYELASTSTNLGDGNYVKQVKDGKTPLTPYPGTYHDYRGDQPNAVATYPGAGQTVTMDKGWLNGLLGVAVNFSVSANVPVWVDQFGIISGTPNAITWAGDLADNCNAAGIGWAYWVWSTPYNSSSLLQDDIGVTWEDSGGNWHTKPDWATMLSQKLTA